MAIDDLYLNETAMDPNIVYPCEGDESVCYLKNIIVNPNIKVGDYTIYRDFHQPLSFERKNVLYYDQHDQERLIIGKFCSIAAGVKFIMNGIMHRTGAFTEYPFVMMGHESEDKLQVRDVCDDTLDIVIGNDVSLGYEAIIMAGVHIGDGVIVIPRSVVCHKVEPYTVVAGIPAQPIRKRFDGSVIETLLQMKWWNWDIKKIQQYRPILCGDSVEQLMKLS